MDRLVMGLAHSKPVMLRHAAAACPAACPVPELIAGFRHLFPGRLWRMHDKHTFPDAAQEWEVYRLSARHAPGQMESARIIWRTAGWSRLRRLRLFKGTGAAMIDCAPPNFGGFMAISDFAVLSACLRPYWPCHRPSGVSASFLSGRLAGSVSAMGGDDDC